MDVGVIEHVLFSGVTVHVTPLSPTLQMALLNAAKDKNPYPDKAPFMKEIENSAIPGDKFFDDQDPEYLRLHNAVSVEIERSYSLLLRDFALKFPDGQETLVNRYRDELRKLRTIKPELNSADEWLTILEYFIVTKADEWTLLYAAAQGSAPLTEGDIREGWRIFRIDVQAYAARKMVTEASRFNRTKQRTG